MTHEILRPDQWNELEKFCEEKKVDVPDRDTSFVAVARDATGSIIGFLPVQPVYAAGPSTGILQLPRALEAIDEHFLLHFGSYGWKYFWYHPENADRAQIRTLQREAVKT